MALFLHMPVMGHTSDLARPLDIQNGRTLARIFLRLPQWGASPLQRPYEWRVQLDVISEFLRTEALDEDAESWVLRGSYRNSLGSEGLEGFAQWGVATRGGGILDPLIDAWHRTVVNYVDDIHRSTPFGRSVISGPGYSFGSAEGLTDLTLGVAKPLGDALKLSVGVQVPTGNEGALLGSGRWDVGLLLESGFALGMQWQGLSGLGYTWQGGHPSLPASAGGVGYGYLTLVYLPNSRDQWLFQWDFAEAPFRSGDPRADRPHGLLSLGYRRQISAQGELTFWFSEDDDFGWGVLNGVAGVGPDIAFGITYRHKP